jgi:PAS domain S-box-containing protein
MIKKERSIYISLSGLFSDELVYSYAGSFAERFVSVACQKFADASTREKLLHESDIWLMDFNCFRIVHTAIAEGQFQPENIPEVLVLIDEVNLNQLETMENLQYFSFFLFPASEKSFQLQLRESLRKAEGRWERIFELQRHTSLFVNSSQPKLIFDPVSGKIFDSNRAACLLFEKSPDEMLNCFLEDLHYESYDLITSLLEKAEANESLTLRLKYFKSKNEQKELQYNFSVVDISGKELVYINIDDITEKGKAYELYYQQTEMLRNTLESIDDLLFSLNRDGDFTEYYQSTGGTTMALSSDVFVGKNIYDVGFPLEVAKKYIQTIETVIEYDKPEQIDYYLEAFGSRLWYNAKISPRKNAFGIADGVTVLCRDVTRQKKNEETLKKARDFYLTLLADFPSMIWKTNPSKIADYFNKTWLEFTGNTLEDEIRSDWSEKLPVADLNLFTTTLLDAYRKKETFQLEHRLKHHTGEFRWVINAGRPFYNFDGQFAGYIGSCYDISDKRKADEMLYLQKSAIDSALEGIMIIEDNGKDYPVIYANHELGRLTGKPQNELTGKAFLSALGCPIDSSIEKKILRTLKRRTSYKGEYLCYHDPDSDEANWRLLFLAPVEYKKENVKYFVALLSDISDSKKVEEALREKNNQLIKTNEELDSFVYSTSHELRSPLMSVLGLLNILETDMEKAERTTYISMIRDSIARLDKIIHDIIDYSRNSRIEIAYEKIDFHKMIDKIIQDLKYVENYEKIKFLTNINDTYSFLSDVKRIETVLKNLISNALRFHKYNQDEPVIDISVSTSPVNAVISVSDNGQGIHEKHIPKIYDMFYKGTQKSNGSGIGLYIVKEIVDKLNGSILLKTELDKGSVFTVDLPNYLNKNYHIVSLAESNN